jgi:hypothetical protein
MVNMQLTAEEAKEMTSCSPVEGEGPKYPYGLCLDLNDESLAKLGITELPPVGKTMMLVATVVVTRTGAYQTQDSDKEMSLGLQITDMELKQEAGKSIADTLYGA